MWFKNSAKYHNLVIFCDKYLVFESERIVDKRSLDSVVNALLKIFKDAKKFGLALLIKANYVHFILFAASRHNDNLAILEF